MVGGRFLSETRPTILYVGLDAAGAAPVLDRLRESGVATQLAPNVYLALARWGRGTVRPAVVIVCVDYLQPPDFEFFSLTARDHARTPVYVCGRPAAAAKLERATGCGARGTIAPCDIDELICDLDSREHPRTAPCESPPDAAVLRIEPPVDAGASAPEPDDDETLTDEDAVAPTATARVPWKDYGGGPARIPPKHPSVPSAPQPAPAGSPLDGPLLTAEELEALMRDDFKTMSRESPLGPE